MNDYLKQEQTQIIFYFFQNKSNSKFKLQDMLVIFLLTIQKRNCVGISPWDVTHELK
jgi:hypothetical protein